MKKNFFSLIFLLTTLSLGFTSCSEDETIPVLSAGFTTSANVVEAGEAIEFTNSSTSATEYAWDFGDDVTSKDQNPEHTYAADGKYTVTLVATNGEKTEQFQTKVYVGEYAYVLNYGGYNGTKSSITLYDKKTASVPVFDYYNLRNNTIMTSNAQSAYQYGNKIYFMGNNVDRITYVDAATFIQSNNGITDQVIKPRNCIAHDDILYVSCWGGEVWNDASISYILKIDTKTDAVIGKIMLAGGPEDLEIANGKLYAALNYDKKVAVIDMASEAITYIDMPGVCSYITKDPSENIFVSVVSSFSTPADQDGLAHINTQNDTYTMYPLSGISAAYVNVMAANTDFSKLYVMTSAYDSSWKLTGAVAVFDVASKAFESSNIVEGLFGINGIGVNNLNDDLNVFISPSTTESGQIKVYSKDGVEKKSIGVGIAPMMLFDIE
ncbi:PKD domain-containing protein [Carboxylicivirga sp. N1Y90]|uniref:PKD domain-containing protein n=1 Tax=Carboxylicivirga fragile TaxID=3417571 RepID=UPI003D341673|nr:PKD domain-containing protein [Marinilabiliaceae bacterium N1Y90]